MEEGCVGVYMCMYVCMLYYVLTFQTFAVGVGAVMTKNVMNNFCCKILYFLLISY